MLLLSAAGLLLGPSLVHSEPKPKLLAEHNQRFMHWQGRPGDTYFVQWSADLVNWSFLPIIYSGDGSAIAHELPDGQGHFFTRLKWTDIPDGGNPYVRDFDEDGLSSLEELTGLYPTDPLNRDTDGDLLADGWELEHGFMPHLADSDGNGIPDGMDDADGDGASNAAEQDNDADPNDPEDAGFPTLEVVGSMPQWEEAYGYRSYSVPAGSGSYLIIAHVHSEEYPYFTEILSPYDDVMRWDIRPSIGENITGSVSVNTLHQEWVQSEADGSSYRGYSPVASKVLGVIHAPADEAISVDVEVGVTNISDDELYSTVMVSMVPYKITPDWNRDGIIDRKDRGKVSAANPWRWWMNDDDDSPLAAGAWDGSGDMPAGDWGDSYDNRVDGIRDLVDFFPIHLDLRHLFTHFDPQTHDFILKQDDGALKIVEVDFANPLAGKGAASHLINVQTADHLKRAFIWRTKDEGRTLSDDFIESAKQGRGMILCEGSNESEQPLKLEIRTKGGTLKKALEMPLKISRVEQMYRHLNLRDQLAEAHRGDPGDLPTQMSDPGAYYPDELTNGSYFVHVHGFANDDKVARAGHAELFKRMHQLGSNARFVGVSWHGDTQPDYHHAVHHAFLTGDILNEKLGLNGDVVIAGHSLGNMVVSQAIEYGGLEVKRYYMINAATPIEAYDPAQTTGADGRNMEEFMTEKSWQPFRAQRKKLFASDWYRLFPANDGRHKLTWAGRFSKKVPLVATNFYSTGEDVVANPREEESVGIHLREAILNFNFAEHAWVSQEISKGSDLLDLVLRETHAGWHFNGESEEWQAIKAQDNWEGRIDELVSEDLVRQDPFYEPFNYPDLYDAAKGSAEANKKDLQYRLLATAIPAKSFAVAANPVNAFGNNGSENINMMDLKKDNAWPRNDPKWLHSDFRNVALCYVYKMYNDMINLEDLND